MLSKLKTSRIKKPLIPNVEEQNLLPAALTVLAGSTFLLALAFMWIAVQTQSIANRSEPTLVQSSSGESFVASPYDYSYRDPKLIQNTAKEWAVLTFSWGEPAASIPGSTDLIDYKKGKISLSAYKASMLISDSFRAQFLDTFAADVFTNEAIRGEISSLYVPLQVLPPQEIEKGHWKVEVLGSRYITTPQNPVGVMKPANFLVELVASEIPRSPLDDDASPSVQAVYSLFESGLRIVDVEEIHRAR